MNTEKVSMIIFCVGLFLLFLFILFICICGVTGNMPCEFTELIIDGVSYERVIIYEISNDYVYFGIQPSNIFTHTTKYKLNFTDFQIVEHYKPFFGNCNCGEVHK